MTPAGAHNLVIGSVVVTGALAAVNSISHGHLPTVRTGLGLAFAGVALTALADVAPDLAGSFAALLLVAALLNVGAPAFSTITKGLTGP